jgi:GDP-mannose transporter
MVHSNDEQHDIQVRMWTVISPCAGAYCTPRISMVGALNKLPVAASGMLFFGDAVNFGSVSAISLGFFAGIVYAVAKNSQKKTDSRTRADTIIPLTNRKG